MSVLAIYDRAQRALAEALQATSVDAVMASRDDLAHIKLRARQIRDRALLADATEFQMRVERRLGVLLAAAKDAGHLREGRPAKAEADATEPAPATLAEIGVDRKLSMKAQRAAAMADEDFDGAVAAMRIRMASGKAILVDPIDGATGVNGSRSIMSSRIEDNESLDFFPTPPWATRALVERVFAQVGRRGDCRRQTAWEPACGEGHIAEVLREYFDTILASDIHDYGYGAVSDFLADPLYDRRADWIITNPPFGDKSEAFLLKAMELARVGVAIFVRLQWLETEGRYERIFSINPPTLIAFFAERVNLCKGRWDPEGGTATAYIWLVWVKGATPRAPFWIAPGCRKQFAGEGDKERFTQHPVAKRIAMNDDATAAPLEGATA